MDKRIIRVVPGKWGVAEQRMEEHFIGCMAVPKCRDKVRVCSEVIEDEIAHTIRNRNPLAAFLQRREPVEKGLSARMVHFMAIRSKRRAKVDLSGQNLLRRIRSASSG